MRHYSRVVTKVLSSNLFEIDKPIHGTNLVHIAGAKDREDVPSLEGKTVQIYVIAYGSAILADVWINETRVASPNTAFL